MKADNAIIHLYPNSPYIVKACVSFRCGKKIILANAVKDREVAERWINEVYPGIPVKYINHKGY